MNEIEAFYDECIIIDMRGMPSLTNQIGVEDFKKSGITMANIQGSTEEAMLLHKWYIDQFDEVTLVKKLKILLEQKKRMIYVF